MARRAKLALMDARTRKVLQEALELAADERCELARELIDSLGARVPAEVERSWAEIIAQRARAVLDGTAPTRDLDEAIAELEALAR